MAETNKKLYWGGKTVHQNSDTYWNKYPLKPGDETFDRKTPHVYRSEEKDERRKNKKRKHSSEEPKHKRSHEDKDDDRYREEDEVEERDDDRHKRKKKKRKESAEEPKHKKSHSDRDNDKEDKKNRERIKDKDKGRDRTKDRVKERDRDVDRYDGRYEDRYGDRYEDRYDEDRYDDRYDDRYNDRYDDESKDVDSYKKKKKRKNRSSEEPSEKKHDRSRPDKSKSEDKEKGKEKESKETKEKKTPKDVITAEEKKTVDLLTSKTGGAYIPPARLKMMQASITDKTSAAYQRIAWEALKKSIHGLINKASPQNIVTIAREILRENVIRGRGLLCRSILQAQAASTTFTNVFASLLAIINSKFPNIGELLLKRCIIRFKQGFRRNDKPTCLASAIFIAHLVNQCVAHEIIALEVLTLLLETPTNDSVEVAIAFLKECGQKLSTVCKRGLDDIFDLLRNVLHEGSLEKRVQYMIEVMFQVRKDGFKDHPSVPQELDLVEEEDQFTHVISLTEDKLESQDILNVFKFDPDYEENEKKYENLKKEFFGSNDESEGESGSEDESGTDESVDSEAEAEKKQLIIDNTETNLVALRRTIYLTINSSLHFEECAHKLLRMELKPGQEMEMCNMFLDCCAEQRTYEKFFGLLAQRFCQINQIYIAPFEQIFVDSYAIVHRFATNKLRNVAKFFAHLLFTDAISWNVLSTIHLNEEETSSSSRIFIKILFQELSEFMTLAKLNERVKDPTMHVAFEGLFPRDNPKNTRFAINFFTSIGLGGLTNELREHLKTQPKQSNVTKIMEALSTSSSSSSSSSDSDSDSSSSSSSSS